MQNAKCKRGTFAGIVCILNFAFCIASAHAQSPVSVGARQLVMPFENATHEPRFNWLAEGSAVALTDDLTALGAQALSRDDRLRALDRLRVPSVATLSEATIIRIGQVVGAAQVIVGSFDVKGNVLTIRARAIRLDQTVKAVLDADAFDVLVAGGLDDRADDRIEARRVATTGQNTKSLDGDHRGRVRRPGSGDLSLVAGGHPG